MFDFRTSTAICESMAPQMRSGALAAAAQTGLAGIRNRLAPAWMKLPVAPQPRVAPAGGFPYLAIVMILVIGLSGVLLIFYSRNSSGSSGDGTWDSSTSSDRSSSSSDSPSSRSSSSDSSSGSDSSGGGGGSSW